MTAHTELLANSEGVPAPSACVRRAAAALPCLPTIFEDCVLDSPTSPEHGSGAERIITPISEEEDEEEELAVLELSSVTDDLHFASSEDESEDESADDAEAKERALAIVPLTMPATPATPEPVAARFPPLPPTPSTPSLFERRRGIPMLQMNVQLPVAVVNDEDLTEEIFTDEMLDKLFDAGIKDEHVHLPFSPSPTIALPLASLAAFPAKAISVSPAVAPAAATTTTATTTTVSTTTTSTVVLSPITPSKAQFATSPRSPLATCFSFSTSSPSSAGTATATATSTPTTSPARAMSPGTTSGSAKILRIGSDAMRLRGSHSPQLQRQRSRARTLSPLALFAPLSPAKDQQVPPYQFQRQESAEGVRQIVATVLHPTAEKVPALYNTSMPEFLAKHDAHAPSCTDTSSSSAAAAAAAAASTTTATSTTTTASVSATSAASSLATTPGCFMKLKTLDSTAAAALLASLSSSSSALFSPTTSVPLSALFSPAAAADACATTATATTATAQASTGVSASAPGTAAAAAPSFSATMLSKLRACLRNPLGQGGRKQVHGSHHHHHHLSSTSRFVTPKDRPMSPRRHLYTRHSIIS